MKKIIVSLLLLFLMLPTMSFAVRGEEYYISNYDINMVVNEDNTFDVTETISVHFNEYKHGIYRSIPCTNTIKREDGSETSNFASITNVKLNEPYTMYKESKKQIIKIGKTGTTFIGDKEYKLQYKYSIGKDPLQNGDEFYYDLIGDGWDVTIRKVNFSIQMPKTFDKEKLFFTYGKLGSTKSDAIEYTIDGNTIKGSLLASLSSGSSLTVRLELPEDYFTNESLPIDGNAIFQSLIAVALAAIGIFFWKKYGKDKEVVDSVEFYPPNNLNSADIGCWYRGYSVSTDIISLLIYLANKGFLQIEEIETGSGIFKGKSFKITKLKDYDGTNEHEKFFFDNLFYQRTEVLKKDLENTFYVVLDKITDKINKQTKDKIFKKSSSSKAIFILLLWIVDIILMLISSKFISIVDFNFELLIFVGCFLFTLIALLIRAQSKVTTICITILLSFATLVLLPADFLYNPMSIIAFIFKVVASSILLVVLGSIKQRTDEGVSMLGKIQGFKNFLEIAEKQKLEELVLDDPTYFYNILPYTYVLGISNKWIKKFETIAVEPPSWYYGYSDFSIITFNAFMHSTYSSISQSMASNPNSSGGGFSGGSFSGGGSGGGGGGSW